MNERIVKLETEVSNHSAELSRGRGKFEKLTTNIQQIMNEMKDLIIQEREERKESFNDFKEALFRELDKRYASKLVEKLVYGAIILILGAVITSLLTLVI